MKTSRIVSVLVVLGLLASPAFALLTYNNIDWPGDGILETGNLRVDDNGNVGIPYNNVDARIWDVGANSYESYDRPVSDKEVLIVFGKTTSGDVGVNITADQYARYWDASAAAWVLVGDGEHHRDNLFDQNDTHAVVFRYDNKDMWTVDLATNTRTFLTNPMQANDPRISANGTVSGKVSKDSAPSGVVTPDGGTTVRLTGMTTKDVNDSGNACGSIAATVGSGMHPYFYDYASNSLTAMPTFGGDLEDPEANNEYHVEGINNSDEVVGYVRRGGHTYKGFYWKKGDADLTDLEDLTTLPGYIPAGQWIYGANAQVTDINNDGWIVGLGIEHSPRESFLLTPEPATLLVLAGGALAGLLRRRR